MAGACMRQDISQLKAVRTCALVVVLGVLLFLGGMETAEAQTGALGHDPTEVIKRLLTLDSRGARLGPFSFEAIRPYVGWGADPVWGHVVVIEGFTIADELSQWEIISNLEVVIPITYTVVGSVYYDKASFVPEPGREELRVRVKAVGNRWRVVEPIIPPHVARKRMLNHVRQAWLDETDLAKRDQLASLQEALKKVK